MGDAKCTFGIRMPMSILMVKETIYREFKHFRNYKTYRPNFTSLPVAEKPSSAHEQLKTETKEEMEKVENYQQNVAQTRTKGPKSKFPSAATENQVYGWYDEPIVPLDRNDRRFYKPKKDSTDTKIGIIFLMSNPKSKSFKA